MRLSEFPDGNELAFMRVFGTRSGQEDRENSLSTGSAPVAKFRFSSIISGFYNIG
jgi:hypothetical protein